MAEFKVGDRVWAGTSHPSPGVVIGGHGDIYTVRFVSQPTGVLVDATYPSRLLQARSQRHPDLEPLTFFEGDRVWWHRSQRKRGDGRPLAAVVVRRGVRLVVIRALIQGIVLSSEVAQHRVHDSALSPRTEHVPELDGEEGER